MGKDNLISKKELLARYSISYGALYRWKRKGLIPEDWFIRKSTVTGQESFFPRDLVCQRVELIQNQKEDISLDELASLLGTEAEKKAVLTVKTALGNKTFYLSEIHSIWLDDGSGNPVDNTDRITKKEL